MENGFANGTHSFGIRHLWYWGGRSYRWEFFVVVLVSWLLAFVALALVFTVEYLEYIEYDSVVIILIATIYVNFVNVIRRFHDVGRTGHWFIMLFAPFVGLYFIALLFFAPGEKERNEWGT